MVNRWGVVAAVMLGGVIREPLHGSADEPSFPGRIAVGGGPSSVALADLNGDLVVDVVRNRQIARRKVGNADFARAPSTEYYPPSSGEQNSLPANHDSERSHYVTLTRQLRRLARHVSPARRLHHLLSGL